MYFYFIFYILYFIFYILYFIFYILYYIFISLYLYIYRFIYLPRDTNGFIIRLKDSLRLYARDTYSTEVEPQNPLSKSGRTITPRETFTNTGVDFQHPLSKSGRIFTPRESRHDTAVDLQRPPSSTDQYLQHSKNSDLTSSPSPASPSDFKLMNSGMVIYMK